MGPDDVLHREPWIDEILVAGDVHGLEVVEKRSAPVPPGVVRRVDDVVTVQRRYGNERHVSDIEAGGERHEFLLNLFEPIAVPVDEIHLVDADDHVGDAEEVREEGMATTLLDDAVTGIDEDHGQVRIRSPGDHVARVLGMTGGIGDDELPLRRREVPVGDVNGDALLAFSSEPVGEERQIRLRVAPPDAGAPDGVELVLVNRLGVVQEATDQG